MYKLVKRVIQYFRFPDRPIIGWDILDFQKKGGMTPLTNYGKIDTCTFKESYFVQPLLIFLHDIGLSDHFRIMQKILRVLITVLGTKRFFRVQLNLTLTFVDQNSGPSWQRIPNNCSGGIILLPPPRHTLTPTYIYEHIHYLHQHDTSLAFS